MLLAQSSNQTRRRARTRLVSVVAALAVVIATPTVAAAGGNSGNHSRGGVEVIASGLDQPRGLFVTRNGVVFVAEAGVGGDDGCGDPILTAEPMCLGESGAITRIARNGKQRRVIEGLPSIANESDGNFAFGPHDVTLSRGRIYVAVGGPGNDLDRSDLDPAYADGLGTVLDVRRNSDHTRTVGDIAAFEASDNPHLTRLQSQTNAVEVIGRQTYAVDAAGNSVVEIDRDGNVELVEAFPNRSDGTDTYEAVPSGLAEGPDGHLYMSDLTGAPFPEGGAIVWRLGSTGFEEYATGFTTAVDLAFGPDGSLYVVENRPGAAGRVMRLAPGETDAANAEVIIDDLVFPTGIAVDRHGAVYVSNNSVFAGAGEVLKIS